MYEAVPSDVDQVPGHRCGGCSNRAERAERMAQERASQIYTQANAVLADATLKVESAADGLQTVVQQVESQLQESRQQLQDAVSAMYAIRPEE